MSSEYFYSRCVSVELILALSVMNEIDLEGLSNNLIVKKQQGAATKTTSTRKLLESIKIRPNAVKLLK